MFYDLVIYVKYIYISKLFHLFNILYYNLYIKSILYLKYFIVLFIYKCIHILL